MRLTSSPSMGPRRGRKRLRRKAFIGASGALPFAVGVPACVRAQSLLPMRVGIALDDQSKPVMWAKANGWFERAGLDVTTQTLTGGGAAIAAAVIGGSLDAGKSNTLELIAAHARGLPLTIIAPASVTGGFDRGAAMIVPTKSLLRTGRDLVGKMMGVTSLVTIQIIAVKAWIDATGGDSSAVRFVEVPSQASQAALESGRIDAACVLEPVLSTALASGSIKVLDYPYGAIAARFDGADYFTTLEWANKHRDALERFVRVNREANAYVTAHEAETNGVLAAASGIDPAILVKAAHPIRPAVAIPAALQPLIDAAAKYRFIPKTFPASELIFDSTSPPSR